MDIFEYLIIYVLSISNRLVYKLSLEIDANFDPQNSQTQEQGIYI